MTRKVLRFMCGLAIVLSLVLVSATTAWAKDTAQLDFADIAARIPKENKNMDILQRTLPLLLDGREKAQNINKDMDSMVSALRDLNSQFSQAIDAPGMSDPNKTALTVMQRTLMYNQAALGSVSLDSIDLQIAQMKIQIPQTEAQLINGGQQLYMGYHQLQDGIKKMQDNRALLQESLNLAQTQLKAGLGTDLAVKQAQLAISELDTGIKQMESQGAQMLSQLKLIVGWPQEQIIKLGDIPRPNREFLGKIKLADDTKTAQNNSYSIKLKQEEYRYTDDDDRKTLIKLEMEAKQEQIAMAVSTQYYKITEANNTLLLEEQRLAVAEEKIKQARLQHQLGLMAEIALQAEETSYATQKDAVESAMNSLFWEIENYKAILAGLS